MTGDVKLNWKERLVLSLAGVLALGLWIGLFVFPWTSKAKSNFPAAPPPAATAAQPQAAPTPSDTTELQSVLSQLGTYGDMFGILNCLFTGAAFWGVIYALILQSRDLKNQHEDMQRNARLAELQNRLAAYQSLADHHRYRRDTADSDIFLKARSTGRERAYAELLENLLKQIERPDSYRSATPTPEPDYHDHPGRVSDLYGQFQLVRGTVTDHVTPFDPIDSLLLQLVEEIAALVILIKPNEEAQVLLKRAGNYVNEAVLPGKWGSESTDQCIREERIKQAASAFDLTLNAVVSLSPAQEIRKFH